MESWGVVSTSTTKEWENATTRCAGYIRVMAGKQLGKGVCKWILATGDTGTGEWEYPATGEPSGRGLVGTRKLKGISGGRDFQSPDFSQARRAGNFTGLPARLGQLHAPITGPLRWEKASVRN